MRTTVTLTILLALLFGLFLGSRPLSVPDEGRYVEIPREMVASGDWVTPRLNHIKYFEKPPLVYWVEASLIRLFGLSEWSVRLGPALFALIGCLAVYGAGSRLFGARAGILSAAVLATSTLYFALGRLISLDMPVSVLLTLSLLSFLLGAREERPAVQRLFFWGFYAAAALATLAKGLIAVLFPAMIIPAWLLLTGEWRILRSMRLLTGTALFLLIAAPWHILVNRVHPEFFDFYFIREHLQRFLTTVHHRDKPFWFYIPVLLLGSFPWSAFLVPAVRSALPPSWKERARHPDTLFLLLWAGIVFLFFSLSGSKLVPYILPALPPLALLTGRYLADAWERTDGTGIRTGALIFAAVSALVAAGLFVAHRYAPEVAGPGMTVVFWTGALWLLMSCIALWINRATLSARKAVLYIVTAVAPLLLAGGAVAPALDTRSLKPLAMTLKPLLKPGDEVAHFLNFYQDLPVYLERRMTIVRWKGELEFGMSTEDTSAWMIDEAELWRRWTGPRRIFLVMGAWDADNQFRDRPERLFLIARHKNTVILSNVDHP